MKAEFGNLGIWVPQAVYLGITGVSRRDADQGVVFTDAHGIRTARAPITAGLSRPIRLAIDAKDERIAVDWTDGGGITVHDVASGTLLDRFASPIAPSR